MNISVIGHKGKMGSLVCNMIRNSKHELSKTLDQGDNLSTINTQNTDVVVEFTVAGESQQNVEQLLKTGVNVVVGTSGWNEDEVMQYKDKLINDTQTLMVIPNFSISAVLMQKFAVEASSYFENVEIIELHHPDKKDAPSGTAISTANAIRKQINKDIPIHSVRLSGYTASQQVLLGNPGEVLTISGDSHDRISFMQGVLKAVEFASNTKNGGVYYGLQGAL